MDTTLAGALIGAVISVTCVVIGWYFGAYEQRRARAERTAALSGALLMETTATAWHILNAHEALQRAVEENWIPTPSSVEIYLPTGNPIYVSAGHGVADLGPVVAEALVEFNTRLDRTLSRTRRICALDGRRVKKNVRLDALKDCVSDWSYVTWAGAECMSALLKIAKPSLTAEQLDSVNDYTKFLYEARSGERWSLPDDALLITPAQDDNASDAT